MATNHKNYKYQERYRQVGYLSRDPPTTMSHCPYCNVPTIISRETEPTCPDCGLVVGPVELVCHNFENYTMDRVKVNVDVVDLITNYLIRMGLHMTTNENIAESLAEVAAENKKMLSIKSWDRAIAYTFFHERKAYPMLSRSIMDMATIFDIGTAELTSLFSRNAKLKDLNVDDPVKRTVDVLFKKNSLVSSRDERVSIIKGILNNSICKALGGNDAKKAEMVILSNKLARKLKDGIIFNNRACAIAAAILKMTANTTGVKMTNSSITKACGISASGGMNALYERLVSGEALE